jgi:hypothetical protein
MTLFVRSLLRQPIELPGPGRATQIERGRLQLVVEQVRSGAYALVAHDGSRSLRYFLGLPRGGRLEVEARAPDYSVQVTSREPLCLAPSGRLRGYLAVPLPHRLVFVDAGGRRDVLADLPPAELETLWLGEGPGGGYVHRASSPFHTHLGHPQGVDRCLVPVAVTNRSASAVRPGHLTVHLCDRDLVELRGCIVAAPRRILVTAEGQQEERVRAPLLRRQKAAS